MRVLCVRRLGSPRSKERLVWLLVVRLALLLALVAAMAEGAASAAAAAVPAPAWNIHVIPAPTHFTPGDSSGVAGYEIFFTNSGGTTTTHTGPEGTIGLSFTLPAGASVEKLGLEPPIWAPVLDNGPLDIAADACGHGLVAGAEVVTCKIDEALRPTAEPSKLFPNQEIRLSIRMDVPACPGLAPSCVLLGSASISGGGAAAVSQQVETVASQTEATAGIADFDTEVTGPDGQPVNGAATRPYQLATPFVINTSLAPKDAENPIAPAEGDAKDIVVELPAGLVGNPQATPRCAHQQFTDTPGNQAPDGSTNVWPNKCPNGSAVGVIAIQMLDGSGVQAVFAYLAPVYNLVPPDGMPAQLGFDVGPLPVYINTKVRSSGDFGVTTYLQNTAEIKRISAGRVTIWGNPADESHNALRGRCALVGGLCPPEGPLRPFLRLPSSCQSPLITTMAFERWLHPGFLSQQSVLAAPVDCAIPDFSPSTESRPTSSTADSPTGLHFDLHLPQAAHESAEQPGEADLRDATVTLPRGLLVNPSSANGLAACSTKQIGLTTAIGALPMHFTEAPAACPNASRIGKAEVITPLLDHSVPGAVYLASQGDNPFGSLLAIYLVFEDPETGIIVKLAGRVTPDERTGQLSTTFVENPQLPVEDFKLDLFEGPRAPLRTPATCGSFETTTTLTPWSAPEGASAFPSDAFQVTSEPGGGACPAAAAGEPNAPSFEAGTVTPTAGAYSPLVVHLNRDDGSQNISRLNVTLPPGATGKLAGIPECSEAEIAQAQARSHPGQGAIEQSSPSCPSSSAIGTVTVGAGAGPDPFHVTGKAYLAGPYEGAPFSAVFITPAIAGPFDLGTVVVRAGLYVNPNTAQVTTKSDPLPSILQGIPLDVRSITVTVDRSQFIVNPTNCTPLTVTGEEISTLNQTAPLSSRFQVGSCQNLKFTPQFTVSTTGKTSKASGASLSVKVAYPAGSLGAQANIGRVDLQLPKQLPARLSTLQKACTEAQFNANPAGCPAASMIGTAKAVTPLLSSPLVGPAILVSHGGAAFPDVEFLLQGEGVLVVLDGKTQIKKGITYSHFETVPDQPITTFEATFPQGPYSVLATNLPASAKNSLCGQALTLPTTLTAQNGALINQTTKATITGCAKTKTLTRAQKLTRALKACHNKHGAKRKACERQARRKYGPLKKAKKK